MVFIHKLKGQAAVNMQPVSLRQVLVAILGAGMVILVIVPILLGIAIQQRTIAPPQLDIQLGGLHLVAYATHTPVCDRYVTPCPPELMASPPRDFYVIWVLTRTEQLASANEWKTGTRLVALPLRNQFDEPLRHHPTYLTSVASSSAP
jgi:hypothetical protein